jgi:hypothetical protein
MLIPSQREEDKLSPEELQQLDKLLANARNFHYSSIVLAGISLAISTIDRPMDIALPLGSVVLPRLQATVVIYLLVLTFIVACDRLLSMARPWMKLDSRRPPFAWFVLDTRRQIEDKAVLFWLIFPVLICAIASAGVLQIQGNPTQTLVLLIFNGILVALEPRLIYYYSDLMQDRKDHRGGRVTYSIYLLYAYRVTRAFFLTILFISPILSAVPAWEYTVRYVTTFAMFSWIILGGLRLVASFRFVYKRIDHYGTKYGFPAESKHYK